MTHSRETNPSPRPNFLLVGAAKSGTTALYHYLDEHPGVYMSPIKEPLFFCTGGVDRVKLERELYPASMENVITSYDDYTALFSSATDQTALGEASVYYLADYEKTIANIQRHLPEWTKLKIVIILRNPIDASYSHYQMYTQILRHYLNRKDVLSFEESLAAEGKRVEEGYLALAHFHWFFYYRQVKAYLESFDNVKIFLFSDLRESSNRVLRELYSFLEVDDTFVPGATGQEYNASGVSRLGVLYRFFIADTPIRRLVRPVVRRFLSEEKRDWLINRALRKPLDKSTMAPETREKLRELYREDIANLERLIDRDLSSWLA